MTKGCCNEKADCRREENDKHFSSISEAGASAHSYMVKGDLGPEVDGDFSFPSCEGILVVEASSIIVLKLTAGSAGNYWEVQARSSSLVLG